MCDVVKKVHVRYLISWWVLVTNGRPKIKLLEVEGCWGAGTCPSVLQLATLSMEWSGGVYPLPHNFLSGYVKIPLVHGTPSLTIRPGSLHLVNGETDWHPLQSPPCCLTTDFLATVCKTVRLILSDSWLSCPVLSVTVVY